MPLVWLLVALVVAFLVGAGYVVASAGPVRRVGVAVALWCLGAAVVLGLAGLAWDALVVPALIAVGFALVLIPAGVFTTLRGRRERRELRGL